MSTSAVGIAGAPNLRFWNTTNGKKAIMAVTGVVLFGFIVGHLLGNLQIFLGRDAFNRYAENLHNLPALVWGTRVVLLISVALHIWSTIQLAGRKSTARPVAYQKYTPQASSYASRTMYMSGPILAAFIIYHLMHFTFGTGGTEYHYYDPYGNVIAGFSVLPISLAYVVAMALLCTHLSHGLWSFTQSLGFNHPAYTPKIKAAAVTIAGLIFLGFASIPVAVLLDVVKKDIF
jgi:succinate dehydrogenase / fumarate reductase cytochrome b subunit